MAISYGIFLDQECVNRIVTAIHDSIPCREQIHGAKPTQKLVRSILQIPANLFLKLRESLINAMAPGLGYGERECLPIFEEALRILWQEGYPPPPEDPDLITWSPPQNGSNSFSCKDPLLAPSISLVPKIPCMMFASSSTTYGTKFQSWKGKQILPLKHIENHLSSPLKSN